MPYANARAKPLTANESSEPFDEALKLESHLQKQLEEDVARIFDESIHTDLEVVCGKLKILTHTCILKARTNHFYAELKTVLHLNIGRDTFDEIYSFISDAYTECDVIDQEREIIEYLRNNLRTSNSNAPTSLKTKEESETLTLFSAEGKTKQKKKNNSSGSKPTEDKVESDVFLTPKCVSPYGEKKLNNSIILSPSTELTKEYYALVPIERNLLEQELNEQDALSSAFQYIIKSQNSTPKISPLSKPTSLSLSSSHTPKTVKHSNSCDTINKSEDRTENLHVNSITSLVTSQNPKSNYTTKLAISTDSFVKNSDSSVSGSEAVVDLTYSPDSLIVDDPSSSSDYLSAAYAGSPGVGPLGSFFQLNVEDNTSKMENIFTSSDSGLENTGLLESLNSHKDLTTADISLTESTLHELTGDEIHCHESTSSSDKHQLNKFKVRTSCSNTSPLSRTPSERSGNGQTHSPNKAKDITKSSKEEKQKQNEEIVIMESSSVSSETGSWESVFPPRLAEKDICEIFINTERQFACIDDVTVTQTVSYDDNVTITRTVSHPKITEQIYTNIVQSSPHKSKGCFIDASSLVDEEDDVVSTTVINELSTHVQPISLPAPSQPVPCSMVNKQDVSPNDWSECNENDDSLEQAENKDQDSIQRDLSPTIFEMTPITEDSLNTNPFEKQSNDIDASRTESNESASNVIYKDGGTHQYLSSSVVSTNTPFNSIMSLKTSSAKQYESEESMNDGVANNKENQSLLKITKYNESPTIVSGDASVEDGLESSIKTLNQNSRKSPKTSNAAAWVVDMSLSAKDCTSKKPADKACESLKYESNFDGADSCIKSRGSVDSDGSEKSSHKFYIDLSSLPDPLPKNVDSGNVAEKKNMFSMYIDLGEKSTLKEMPSRLSSSLQTKKQSNSDVKTNARLPRVTKAPLSECIIPTFPKIFDPNESPSTFETYESLCSNPNITVSEIISMSNDKSKTITRETVGHRNTENEKRSKTNSVNGEKSSFSIVSNVIKEETSTDPCVDLFVKLSDLDKPLFKPDLTEFNNERKDGVDVRMTRSIPENNWGEQNHAVSSRSIEVISSFHSENALSLNRLFPHLKNEFSKSMPGSLSGKPRTSFRQDFPSSPGEMEEPVSDVSELSSVQSSSCRPGLENSTTETSQTSSLKGNFQSRLGQDLLRMFLQEIAPDVIVEVSGKRIKAHKCILSSRCQYFAGILSGGWVESAGNVIVMPPFSYNVVHFALCHIYSGVSTIPDSVSIVELATIADMLGLEGLKEAIMFHLKSKYCHHFHKPCPVCTAGVLECFPLLSVYGLDDLYRKCIRWITKYFQKVWPTKAFASLPRELVDKCYQEHIVNFTVESVIDTVYGCGMIAASLQPCKWSESIERLCRRLVNAAAHFAAPRLSGVLPAAAAVPADAPPPARHAVADCLTAAIQWAPPDETCRAYALLSSIVKEARAHLYCKPDLVHNGPVGKTPPQHNLLTLHANAWRMQCENALVSAAPRVVAAPAFEDLPPDLRKRLRELGCITVGAQASSHSYAPKTQSSRARTSSTSKSLNIEHVRASFVPYKPKPLIAQVGGPPDKIKSSNELRDVKKVPKLNPPKIRTTKTQEERAKFNQMKTNKSVERVVKSKAPIRVNVFENTKPRYLEPRPCKDSLNQATKRLLSSSESSRSSPVLARSTRASRAKTKAQTMSRDSLATHSRPRTAEPSTDSLSESQTSNKFGTYTKPKQTSKGSVESVKSQKFQNILQSPIFNNKTKTKIPVHTSYSMKPITDSKKNNDVHKRYIPTCKIDADMPTTSKNKTARKLPGSLMNATKSSSAKMVSKVAREPPVAKAPTKQSKHHKQTNEREEFERPLDIPVMGRSGTFLKDEPTFGDKTTDIDVSP